MVFVTKEDPEDNESGQVPLSDPLSIVLRPKFGLRIFLDQISVARSSSDLSRVLDRIWVN